MGSQTCSCSAGVPDVAAASDLNQEDTSTSSSMKPSPILRPAILTSKNNMTTLRTWSFSPLDMELPQLETVAFGLLHRGIKCGLEEKICHFVSMTFSEYKANPYHNHAHAVDVTQAVFRFGELMGWKQIFDENNCFSLLVAAVAHDIGHPGVNNAFLVDVRDALAYRYNDVSPLENMHCSKLFNIIQRKECDVFCTLSSKQFTEMRKTVIDVILHTDMVHHGEMTRDLKCFYEQNRSTFGSSIILDCPTPGQKEILKAPGNKQLIFRTILHGADVVNPARPWDIALSWARNLVEEFFQQGDREKSLGMPIGFLNDRHTLNFPDSQLSFIKFVYAPFLAAQIDCAPWCQALAANLAENVHNWSLLLSGSRKDAGLQQVDKRVEEICSMLARGGPAWEEAEVVNADGSTGSTNDQTLMSPTATEQFALDLPTLRVGKLVSKEETLVREVRRWREDTTDSAGRQLVLFYVLPDQHNAEIACNQVVRGPLEGSASRVDGRPKSSPPLRAADSLDQAMDTPAFDNLFSAILFPDRNQKGLLANGSQATSKNHKSSSRSRSAVHEGNSRGKSTASMESRPDLKAARLSSVDSRSFRGTVRKSMF